MSLPWRLWSLMETAKVLKSRRIFNILPFCHLEPVSNAIAPERSDKSWRLPSLPSVLHSSLLCPLDPNHFSLNCFKKLPNFSSSFHYRTMVHQTYPVSRTVLFFFFCLSTWWVVADWCALFSSIHQYLGQRNSGSKAEFMINTVTLASYGKRTSCL